MKFPYIVKVTNPTRYTHGNTCTYDLNDNYDVVYRHDNVLIVKYLHNFMLLNTCHFYLFCKLTEII